LSKLVIYNRGQMILPQSWVFVIFTRANSSADGIGAVHGKSIKRLPPSIVVEKQQQQSDALCKFPLETTP
jgi:hypothetical protein